MPFKKNYIRWLRTLLLFLLLQKSSLVAAQLTADFTANITEGCTPLVVLFRDASAGIPTEWKWDLGNGAIASQRNPSAVYITPGKYTIKLTVKNSNGEDSVTKVDYITVHASPEVNFSGNPLSGCVPVTVQFSDSSHTNEGILQTWSWDFGDGTASSLPNPLHTYSLPDTFNVTLIVTNSFGCISSQLKQAYIQVADSVKAAFDYTYTNICQAPSTINFRDISQSPPLTYKWDFGDGGTSSQSSPSHTFLTSGSYQVKLVAANSAGCIDSTTQTINIGSQTADFIVASGTCVNEPVVMQDSSLPHPVSGTWNFGDGNTGSGLTVSHIYTTPGTYTITYTANFGTCHLTVTKTITVTTKPTAAFNTADVLISCKTPLTVQFNNTSANASAYFWDFGDGSSSNDISPVHTYNTTGSFTVTLIAINPGGCNDTLALPDFVKISAPVINGFASLPFTGCVPSTVGFRANISSVDSVVSYLWQFGDGTTSTLSETSHFYNLQGNYNVKLTITTAGGCIDTFTMVSAVTLGNKPNADFIANPLNTCASTFIQFTDKSTGNGDAWFWEFGDGGISSDPNPLYKYGDTGYFTVKLTVTNTFCSDTLTRLQYIYINPPVSKFLNTPNCDTPFTKVFTDYSIAPLTWHWDFGNGDTSVEQSPVYTYDTTGTYYVTLIVTNGNCADTSVQPIYVINENPSFTVTPLYTNFCKSDSIQLTATNYNAQYIGLFEWNFGDSTSLPANGANNTVYHIYQQAGTYLPVLITTDINGCRDTAVNSVPIDIYGPTAAFSNPSGFCRDSLIIFTDSSYTDGTHAITKWIWNYGDGITDTLTGPPFTHAYNVARNYGVKLIVYDNNGCADTLLKPIAVSVTSPTANFTPLDSIRCTSSSVTFINNSSGASLRYFWDFGDDTTSTLQSPVHLYTNEGIYSV
ncbi:MAG TPA: PKD domain-containing protein, partial [Chitinophagaceae bacterium]|nr:PKD domain-containing protein [Chitinophagaceae bacterium]